MGTSSPLPSVILETLTSAIPAWLIILLVVLLILGVIFRPRPPRRRSMVSPKLQLEAVRRVEFERCPLLNRSESAVLVVLEEVLRNLGGHRLMAQTSLGEVIRPVPRSGTKIALEEARASINSKRLDFAVFEASGALVLTWSITAAAIIIARAPFATPSSARFLAEPAYRSSRSRSDGMQAALQATFAPPSGRNLHT